MNSDPKEPMSGKSRSMCECNHTKEDHMGDDRHRIDCTLCNCDKFMKKEEAGHYPRRTLCICSHDMNDHEGDFRHRTYCTLCDCVKFVADKK